MKKQQQIFFILLLIIGSKANAQESLNTSGGNIQISNGSVSYSIGQVFYTVKTGSLQTLVEGVNQPYEVIILDQKDFDDPKFKIVVYPNPTISKITLEIHNLNFEDLSYKLFNMTGKLISQNKIKNQESEIQMEFLASSIYFLNIISENKTIKTIKIIKK